MASFASDDSYGMINLKYSPDRVEYVLADTSDRRITAQAHEGWSLWLMTAT